MYKAVKKTKAIWRYMEALELHTGAHTVHWEETTSCISVVEAKIFTLRVKHIDITVFSLQEQCDNSICVTKYDKSSVITENMCIKTRSGPIISRSTKWMTGYRVYINSDN